MRKEMKKNNKMLLALVVVAALAMVSVAAVAVESSDAEEVYWKMGADNKLIINGTSTSDYNFYSPDGVMGKDCPIEITASGKYTGTLSIGTLDSKMVFTPLASLKLTDASNVMINAKLDADGTAYFEISNVSRKAEVQNDGTYVLKDGVPGGTFELMKGEIKIGIGSIPFNGTVSAGGFSMKAEYVTGAVLAITDDGKVTIEAAASAALDAKSEGVTVPSNLEKDGPYVFPSATLSLSGEASISRGASFIVTAVNVTVEDGAVITAGDEAATMADEVTIEVEASETLKYAFLESKGSVIASDSTGKFENVPFGSYTLYVFVEDAAGKIMPFKGTATVTSKLLTIGSNSLVSSKAIEKADDTPFMVGGDGELLFVAGTTYKFSTAYKITSSGIETGKPSAAKVVFTGVGVVAGDTIFATLINTDTGNAPAYFYGKVSGPNDIAFNTVGSDDIVTLLTVAKPADAVTTGQIKAKDVTVGSAPATFEITDGSKLLVKGSMKFLFVDELTYGELNLGPDGYLEFAGEGIVSHEIDTALYPADGGDYAIVELPSVFLSNNLAASYYIVNDADKKISTYYFTTINNAIKNSNKVYLDGDIVITEDTTLANPDGKLEVILTTGSSLKVGNDEASPTLTIPGDTTLTIQGYLYEVVNGKAVYDVQPAADQEPVADILIKGDKCVYTDIATALDMAVSGDTLELRRDAELKKDATVKNGVTLKDSDLGDLTIPEKKTLTVDGALESNYNMIIDGVLIVNKTADFKKGSEVTLNGTIWVKSTGTVNFTSAKVTGDGILQADGEVNLVDSEVEVSELIVENGTLTIDKDSKLTVTKKMLVGKQPEVSTENVNSSTITGVVTLGSAAVATVYGEKDMEDILTATGVKKVEYMIDGKLYVTVYCMASDKQIEMLYEDQLKDIVILNWNNEKMYRGAWLISEVNGSLNTAAVIGSADWEIVYAKFEPKMYSITCDTYLGVTWTVNGYQYNGSEPFTIAYGKNVTVKALVQPGYEGTPSITANGSAYNGSAMKVVGDVNFKLVDGSVHLPAAKKDKSGLTLIEILLIIIVIIIALIAIVVAIRLLRS